MLKKTFGSKKKFKQKAGSCHVCKENKYELLDVHRWRIEGKDGGKYTANNCICVCARCHRLIHANKIKIIGVFNSTFGMALNYIDEEGKEQFKRI